MTSAISSRSARVPGTIRCIGELLRVKICLRVNGFRDAVRYAVTGAEGVSPLLRDAEAAVALTARRVAVAGAFFPGRVRCLEQSLVLCHLLRRMGVPATFRVGVQPYRFRAHAWVEYNGTPIAEPGDGVTGYMPFPEIPL